MVAEFPQSNEHTERWRPSAEFKVSNLDPRFTNALRQFESSSRSNFDLQFVMASVVATSPLA